MKITIHIDNLDVGSVERTREALRDKKGLHLHFGFAGEQQLRDHMADEGYLGYTNKLGGKSTGFYKGVHDSISSEADEVRAIISTDHRGAALRFYGGTVTPTTRKSLSVPVEKSAHGLNASEYPQDLLFIPAGPNANEDTAGYLFLKNFRPRKDGKPGTVAEPGEMIYVLRTKTHHSPDPNLLPSEQAIRERMTEAGREYFAAARRNSQPPAGS